MAKKTAAPKGKRKWRPAPEALVKTFEEALESLPGADRRKMFGYPCAFVNGQMFTGLHQEYMILRLPEDERLEFLRYKDTRPFEPMPGRVMREYAVIPPSILNSGKKLDTWLQKAFEYAKSLSPKPPKKKKRTG